MFRALAVLLAASLPLDAFAQSYAAARSATPRNAGTSVEPVMPSFAGTFQILPTAAPPLPATLGPEAGVQPVSAIVRPAVEAAAPPAPAAIRAPAVAAVGRARAAAVDQAPDAKNLLEAGDLRGRAWFDGAWAREEKLALPGVSGARAAAEKASTRGAVRLSAPSAPDQGHKPVFVMTPLTPITDWAAFRRQLDTLKRNGVTGVTSDLWWGRFEGAGKGRYDWTYYKAYADAVRAAGLQWDPILSFHQCGGNVGDVCAEPLPRWLWSGPDAEQEMKFVDERGFVNGEYIAFWHEGAYRHYDAAMASFAAAFADYSDIITRVSIGLGPAGELRYPSYNFAAGWSYPARGRLQAYSAAARRSFRESVRASYGGDLGALNRAWGSSLRSFDEIQPPGDGDRFFRSGASSPYGRDFLAWYQGSLERHLDRMMTLARKRLSPAFSARLSGKVAGVHWLYNSPETPHAAERAAGYVDYDRLAAQFQKSGAELAFTALEMDDARSNETRPGEPPPFSAPQALAREIARSARSRGVHLWGENALPIHGDSRSYRNIREMLANEGFGGFSLLRLDRLVDSEGNPTSDMALFVRHVVSPGAVDDFSSLKPRLPIDKPEAAGSVLPQALALLAVVGALALGGPWLVAHYAAAATFSGWAANAAFLFFPFVQIRENFRNARAFRRGDPDAGKRLEGVSVGTQQALIAGNMLNFPLFVASGNAALIANGLMGAAGSLAILLQLGRTGHFPMTGWALLAGGVAALAAAAFVLPLPALFVDWSSGLATGLFAAFNAPQIDMNNKALAALSSAEPEKAAAARQHLQGTPPSYPLMSLLGNLLLIPVFMVSGKIWNVLGGIATIGASLLVLRQLARAGLFPDRRLNGIALGAVALSLAAVAASYAAWTPIWR